jgi:uncharacterized RDD family membrane protein YckC
MPKRERLQAKLPSRFPAPVAELAVGSWIYDYASFWTRLLAALIDLLALSLVQFAFLYFFEPRFFLLPQAYFNGPASFRFYFVAGVASLLYFSFFECSTWQATPGKRLLGIKVVSLRGEPIPILPAVCRFLAKLLSLAILGLGILMILWTPRKQGLHDLLIGSLVVRVLRPPQPELAKKQLQEGAGI